jgi:serine protease Do
MRSKEVWIFKKVVLLPILIVVANKLMLKHKQAIFLITIPILAGIGWRIESLLMPTEIAMPIDRSISVSADNQNTKIEKIAKGVTIRILNKSAPGSGVMILQQKNATNGRKGTTYTVLTCQHVVAENKKGSYRVLLPDGKIYPARLRAVPKFKNLDLALVEFDSELTYPTIELGDSRQLTQNSAVYASGFPNYHVINPERIEETSEWGKKAFKFTMGKVGLISSRSLPEGYSLGYTNEIELGMSGGPVLNDNGKLVGINGRLKYPIQGINAFIFADGTKPSVAHFQRMEALSWAIPISAYQQIADSVAR